LSDGAESLGTAGIENPRLEARLLLAHALDGSSEALLRDTSRLVGSSGFDMLLARRCAREPLALILGRREFWSLDFAVSGDTLIPRPESETLIDAALAAFPDREMPRAILDLGTGTGCLLLAALHEFPRAFGVGVDRSAAAAALAARNAAALGLADRTAFACADWDTPLSGRFDLVLCNPPYIPTSDIVGLMPEVARYEPRSALDGGTDGLDAYRRVVTSLSCRLTVSGVAILELGQGQAESVASLALEAGLTAEARADLLGITRALVLRRGAA
jgi:release factor glutamine methyltransferase